MACRNQIVVQINYIREIKKLKHLHDMKKDNNLKNKHVAQTIFPQRLLN